MLNGQAFAGHPAVGLNPRDPRRTLTSLGVIVYTWDLASDRIVWGPNAAEVVGVQGAAVWATGQDFAVAVEASHGATRADVAGTPGAADDGAGVGYAVTYRLRLADGRVLLADDAGRWFADADGQPATMHGTMRLRPVAGGLGEGSRHRSSFLSQLGSDLIEVAQAKRALTVFTVSVANLAALNEEIGFDAADHVLDTVLARLAATTRARDRFARFSANRFALALRGCGPAEAAVAAERLQRLVTQDPIGTSAGPVTVQLAIGAASAPDHAMEAGSLVRKAETVLGFGKRRDGAGFLLHDPRLMRSAERTRRQDPVLDSIDLLNGRRIVMALQPVVESSTREVAFREALLRVTSPDGRVHTAGHVVPALERAGLVHLADARMLELAADHLAAHPHERVSLNVSALTLDRPDWLATLSAHLGSRPGIASRLILELTETAAMRDPEGMRRTLDAVKTLDVAVALDDFGAGHTSFRHLRNLPIDMIKIDGAFIQNLSRSRDDQFFVRTLIDLAHHLGLTTVAEWVEDEATAALLGGWGVDFFQGDHFGRAGTVEPARNPGLLVA